MILFGVMASAYNQYGQAGKAVAVFGILALLLASVGMYFGVNGVGEEDTYQLLPWLGCISNGAVIGAIVLSYFLGW